MNPQTIQLIIAGVAAISKVISNSKPNNTYNNCNITTNNNYYNNNSRGSVSGSRYKSPGYTDYLDDF